MNSNSMKKINLAKMFMNAQSSVEPSSVYQPASASTDHLHIHYNGGWSPYLMATAVILHIKLIFEEF